MSTNNGIPSASEHRMLFAKEVAAMIGISVDSVYRHVPCIRIGGTIRYSEADVKEFVAKNKLPRARRPKSSFASRKRQL